MIILIVSKNNFFKSKFKKKNFFFIQDKKKLNLSNLTKIKPDIIFFPHWSWKIKQLILDRYLCIGFHATPLPYGRGGTPIQNMILRGFSKTKLCAFKIEKKYDSGPVYFRKSVSLKGSGDEIFKRLYQNISEMILKMSKKLPKPKKQNGKIQYFKRRKPKDSKLRINSSLTQLYDFIRMLDVSEKNFPKAYFKIGKMKYEFSNAKKIGKKIKANVVIRKLFK